MVARSRNENLRLALIVQIVLGLILFFWLLAITASAQTVSNETRTAAVQTKPEVTKSPVLTPVLKDYKAVAIGMTADEVKDKLGKAEVADKDGFYYKFSNEESAQIALDKDNKVRAISIIYKVKGGNPPKLEDVLGTDTGIEPNADGSVYKLVRYPESGFWVAYNRTAGDNAIVTVTFQKL
jgi:hypothetical protein